MDGNGIGMRWRVTRAGRDTETDGSVDRKSDMETGEESRCSQYFTQLSAQEINGLCRVSIVESKNS